MEAGISALDSTLYSFLAFKCLLKNLFIQEQHHTCVFLEFKRMYQPRFNWSIALFFLPYAQCNMLVCRSAE